jgi:hypothetical protein
LDQDFLIQEFMQVVEEVEFKLVLVLVQVVQVEVVMVEIQQVQQEQLIQVEAVEEVGLQ